VHSSALIKGILSLLCLGARVFREWKKLMNGQRAESQRRNPKREREQEAAQNCKLTKKN